MTPTDNGGGNTDSPDSPGSARSCASAVSDTVSGAFAAGASHVVVGRSVARAADPVAALLQVRAAAREAAGKAPGARGPHSGG